MNWWRSRRRGGAGLGLLALLVQIVLSFGHLHLQDIRPAAAAPAPKVALSRPEPAQQHVPPGLPDDDCPICMAVHMAASGLVSVPPALSLPTEFSRIAHSTRPARDITVARYILYRTRAPPTV
jgi:hypothetical protein